MNIGPDYVSPCGRVQMYLRDCREALPSIAGAHAIVTDPPYGLGFMGKSWDKVDLMFKASTWEQAKASLLPGGHVLAFGGSRTYHRLACAVEDAGLEIRDQIMWLYGSGFPKSQNVGKAIDKAAGAEREKIPEGKPVKRIIPGADQNKTGSWIKDNGREYQPGTEIPVTEAAARWEGYGTALKPAHEPIVLARKPLNGTVAKNVQEHGGGALNIDGCRIEAEGGRPKREGEYKPTDNNAFAGRMDGSLQGGSKATGTTTEGRWPANVIHDGSDEVLDCFPDAPGQQANAKTSSEPEMKTSNVYGRMRREKEASADSDNAGEVGFKMKPGQRRLDAGSAARFFYCAKAPKSERTANGAVENKHPTVKPLALMRYLCRLVKPPEGGLILDPFAGSGSTVIAAAQEGFTAIGIEQDLQSFETAIERVEAFLQEGAAA